MRPRATVLAALALAAICAPAAHGASRPGPQALDGRFGSCGLSQDRTSKVSAAERVAIAPDGSAVVAGTAGDFSNDNARILLRRLRPDGSIDPSFADKGLNVAQVPFAKGEQANYLALTGLAIAGDGKILVSGFAEDQSSRDNSLALLARFNVDGTLDGSFGSGGLVLERLQAAAAELFDLAIAPDGKIVAAGGRATGRDDPEARGLVVARFNPDGTRDAAFGSSGVAAPELGDFKPTRANALRLLADGRILVAGQAEEQFALARLTAAGELDPSFATGGVNVTSPPGSSALTTMEVDGAGRIVAAGTTTNISGSNQLVLARYLPRGTLDPSFGAGGFTVDGGAFGPEALALSSDGTILATGTPSFTDGFGFADPGSGLLRYSANGKRDASFGAGGALAVLSSRVIETNDVALAPDGTALVAQALEDTFAAAHFTVARFAVGQPALAAIAGLPRICRLTVGAKTIARVLRKLSNGQPSLPMSFLLTRPAEVSVKATVVVGGRRAKLGTATKRFNGAGSMVVALKVPPSAVKLLRGARMAEVQVSAQATDGGPVTTATRTLGR